MSWKEKVNNPTAADFQTPPEVCKYMVGLISVEKLLEPLPGDGNLIATHRFSILEPTPGDWNIVRALEKDGYVDITTPSDFFTLDPLLKFDAVVMNPPFSSKHAFGVPEGLDKLGMRLGYHILQECMKKSDCIIALMPWFTITDSDVRMREIKAFGLRSITALPRKTFGYARIQTCIFQMHRGWTKETIFKTFDF